MTDTPAHAVRLRETWRSLGQRLAVAAGCLVALVSLFHHVSASTASLRGAASYLVVRVIASLGLFALERSLAAGGGAKESRGDVP